jgi:tripartite-type tricarboxylate transporter receptor subunit TctC
MSIAIRWPLRILRTLIFTLASFGVLAQPYPNKPIRLVVPFALGGSTDTLARIIAKKLTESAGQKVVVDNRPGAGGTLGFEIVAKAPADGYVLIMGPVNSLVGSPGIFRRLPYDPVRDFNPVTSVAVTPYVLVVNPSVPAKSVKELIALAKAKPGQIAFSSPGSGSVPHLTGELFNSMAGIKIAHIPYKGSGPALSDVLAGYISMTFGSPAAVVPQVKSGRVRPLAVTSATRFSALPDVPTIAEAGLPGFDVSSKLGIFAPAKTPREVITKLNTEITKILATRDVQQLFLQQLVQPKGSSPEQLAIQIKEEMPRWAKVIDGGGGKGSVAPPPSPPPRPAPQPKPASAPPSPWPEPPQVSPPPTRPRAYWNTWFENGGSAYEVLRPKESYNVVLDLSRYSYIRDLVAAAGDLDIELERAVKQNRKELTLNVQVMVMSDNLRLAASANQVIPVRLDAIRQDREKEFEADRLRLMPQLSAKYSAGRLQVPVITNDNGGCAQVAFSIWDSGFSRPLDHVVLTLPIRADGAAPGPSCGVPRVQGAFAALNGALSATTPPTIDAALHLFEFGDGASTRMAAVYVDSHAFANSKPHQPSRERGIYHWFLTSSLRNYVATDLVAAVTTGRNAGEYSLAANELARKIFRSDADPANDPAELALQSLARIARDKATPPIVLVRAMLADGHHMYVPLALLAAQGGKLGKRPNVVYPMPRENYDDNVCVDNWTLGIPDAILENQPISIPAVDLSSLRRPPLRSLLDVVSYFEYAAAASTSPEALVLLAHQSKGRLWFKGDGTAERMFYDDIRKQFANGSVAVLAACGTASPDNGNQLVLERLNLKGFDAMVVSPFPVPEPYGKALTLAIVHVVNDARVQRKPLTLVEIFDLAVEYMVAQEAPDSLPEAVRERRRRETREKALEFIITGHHAAKLCVQP